MNLTGNNLLILPEVNQLIYSLQNISVQTSCINTINFLNHSGSGIFSYILSGRKIFYQNPIVTRNIGNYMENQTVTISGNSLTNPSNTGYNYLDHTVNGVQINDFLENLYSKVYSLQINVASGDSMNIDIFLNSTPINYFFDFPVAYGASGNFNATFNTDTSFWVLGTNTTFGSSYQSLFNLDPFIGPISANSPTILTLTDEDPSDIDYTINFQSYFNSNIGNFIIDNSINRTGNQEMVATQFTDLTENFVLSGEFDGIWSNNAFTFSNTPEVISNNYLYIQTNALGSSLTGQNISIDFKPVSPLNGGNYQAQYITGFQLQGSGEYLTPPTVTFPTYYYVTGIAQSLSSMLFSSGCTGNLPITFTSSTGANASGYLSLFSVVLQNIYQTGIVPYNIPIAFNLLNSGTGYFVPPTAILQTGIYNNCYDVPTYYNQNISIFNKFNTVGLTELEAAYLTGAVITTTGLVSGGQLTGFLVSGLDIYNIGYGYDNIYLKPTVTFIRQSGDTLTHNASGLLLNKLSGIYNFTGVWTVSTGWTTSNLYPISGISPDTGNITITQNYFTVSLSCSGLDNTSNVITELTLNSSDGTLLTEYFTGSQYYNSNPYFLKKKIDVAELISPSGSVLDFLTSQSDLQSFYSSSAFTSASLGDLNF